MQVSAHTHAGMSSHNYATDIDITDRNSRLFQCLELCICETCLDDIRKIVYLSFELFSVSFPPCLKKTKIWQMSQTQIWKLKLFFLSCCISNSHFSMLLAPGKVFDWLGCKHHELTVNTGYIHLISTVIFEKKQTPKLEVVLIFPHIVRWCRNLDMDKYEKLKNETCMYAHSHTHTHVHPCTSKHWHTCSDWHFIWNGWTRMILYVLYQLCTCIFILYHIVAFALCLK